MALTMMVQSSLLVYPPLRPHHCQFFIRQITSPHFDSRMLSVKYVVPRHISNGRISSIKHVASLQTDDRLTGLADSLQTDDRMTGLMNGAVKQMPRPFWARKWLPNDVFKLAVFVSMHMLCLWAPFYFTWPAFWVAVSLIIITGMFGITLSYHRNLSHRSFTLPKWLEYTFAYCGVIGGQGSPIDWVRTHRYHHQFTDTKRDPHSPNEGFWFSHMNWSFDGSYIIEKCKGVDNVGDLRKQAFYRFLKKTDYLHFLAPGVLLYALGGFPFLVWGMGVRVVVHLHTTFFVASVCHLWGQRAWNTNDTSRNSWWVALLAFGEGWHNNHHAFEYSARQGLEWWQVDMTWGVIRLLEMAGLATDVKLPTEAQKKKMALKS